MSARINCKTIVFCCLAAIAGLTVPLRAQQSAMPAILNQVSIAQNLNTQISPDLVFRDENGKTVRLGDFFGQKPIVLSLVYFDCPALCTEVLNGELRTMRSMSLDLGKDYEAVTVSFEPKDTSALAKAKRDVYAGQYSRPAAADHWHFLTGSQQSIDALTQAVGFHYAYDSANREYAHAAAIMVLTPNGKISRYFYGVQYPARDVRLGLVEASHGTIGNVTDHALLFCYQYDPTTGKYGLIVMNVVRGGGVLTLLALGIFMFVMFRRDRQLHVPPPAVSAKIR
jgi:protein SCO1/2